MKKVALVLLIVTLFVVACSPKVVCNDPYIQVGSDCCLDQNQNKVCDQDDPRDENFLRRDSEKGVENYSVNVAEGGNSTITYSTLAKIQKEIQLVIDGEASWIEVEKNRYYELGAQKRAAIVVFDSPLILPNDFIKIFDASGWSHEGRFVNLSAYSHLFKPVGQSSFVNPTLFKEYTQEGTFVRKETHERTFLLDHGKVIEYQQLNWEYDRYNYFKGEWQDNVVVYKIYCNPSMVVYLRPELKDTRLTVLTAKMDDVETVWEATVQNFRPVMLQKANRILKACAVNTKFFTEMEDTESDSEFVYSKHDPTYLHLYWDMTTALEAPVERSAEDRELHTVKFVRVTFENKEEGMIKGPLYVDIRTIADNGHERDYIHDKKMIGNFLSGETITRTFYPEEDPQFDEKLVIKVKLYTEDGSTPIRPQEFVIRT